jgi:hypothetical protein
MELAGNMLLASIFRDSWIIVIIHDLRPDIASDESTALSLLCHRTGGRPAEGSS